MVNKNLVSRVFHLSDGLNTSNNSLILGDNEVSVSKNIDLSNPGQIAKRKGYTELGNTGSYTIQGLYRYRQQDGDEFILCNSNDGNLYKMDALDGTWDSIQSGLSTTATDRFEYCSFNDKAIAVNGTTQSVWTGTGSATALSGSPPSGIDVEEWLDRLWMIDGTTSNLYWSASKDEADWTVASDYTPIGYKDGSVPKNIKSSGNNLYVWKYPKGLFRVTPATDSRVVSRVTQVLDIGCVGVKACTKTPQGIVWFDGNTVWLWDESSYPKDIGGPIREDLLSCNYGTHSRAVVFYNPDKYQILLSVAYGSAQTTNNRVYTCSLRNGYRWTYHDIPANDFALLQVSGKDTLYFASSAADGKTFQAYAGWNDDSAGINAELKSKWLTPRDFEVNAKAAYLDFIKVVISSDGDWNTNIGFERDSAGFPEYFAVNQYTGGFIIGTGIIGLDTIGGGAEDVYYEKRFKGKGFERIRLCVRNNVADQYFTIKSIEVGIVPRYI